MRITTQRSSLHAPTVAAAVRVTSWLRVPVVFVSSSRLSAAVRQVLEAQYDSFEKLEIGLALQRAPAQTSSVPELTRLVQLPEDVVDRTVDELCRAGTVHVAGGLVRLTLQPHAAAAAAELAELYDEDRVLVARTLSEISLEKIRGMAARTFADAFQLRKNKKKGD